MHLVFKHLSWKRIAIFSVLLSIFLGISTYFFSDTPNQGRERQGSRSLYISDQVKQRIVLANRQSDIILAVQVVTLDFQKNIRIETFMDIGNTLIQSVYDKFIQDMIYEVPIFTQDVANDTRMLKIFRGDFVCVPYVETIAYTYAPDLEKLITTACAMSIPPGSVDTLGILTIYITGDLTPSVERSLKLFSKELTTKIYEENQQLFRLEPDSRQPKI